eukprot:2976189-Pyramimonas_sp.AAC.1
MRLPHPGQRFAAPQRAPLQAPVAVFACVPPTQDSVSWPHIELHLRPEWRCSHAYPPPRTAFRGPTGSST